MSATPAKEPLAKRVKCDFSKTFNVLVGPGKKQFTVHHDILTQRSGFFEAARSSRWVEGSDTPTDLSDHDPECFSNYLQRVYIGTVISPSVEVTQWIDNGRPGDKFKDLAGQMHVHFMNLVELYTIADKLDDVISSNIIIDALIIFKDQVNGMPGPTVIRRMYDRTPPGSPLRLVARDLIIYEAAADFLDKDDKTHYPKQLLYDLATEYIKISAAPVNQGKSINDFYNTKITNQPKCRYHQHNDKHPPCE